MRNFSFALCFAGMLVGMADPGGARAQEPDELRLMREPGAYTDVIDALDEGDPFDLNISIGFIRSRTAGNIQREEQVGSDPHRGSHNWVDISEHEHLVNTLMFEVDVGVWHDVMAYMRMPLILSDQRNLSVDPDRTRTDVMMDLEEPNPDSSRTALFDPAFDSPDRSGIDYLAFGAAWSIFNQMRNPEFPTWLIAIEGRFNYGDVLRPCNAAAGDEDCGISSGSNYLRLETRASHRYRYIEPYAGLSFDIGWPSPGGDEFFIPGGDLAGYMNSIPSRVGEMTVGMFVVPWEHKARWQRFGLDLRFTAAYISEGHTQSPLFDALGTSASPHLTMVNREGVDEMGIPVGREVKFTGLTDVESHGRFGVRAAIEMQAARYVRFYFGGAMFYNTPYLITFTDSCNPNVDPDADDTRIGTCRRGIINPHHRPVLDIPGQRFRDEGEITLDLFAYGVAQF